MYGNTIIEIPGDTDFDPVKTFECGQCFRWNADKNGVYTGIASNRAAKVWRENKSVFISCAPGDYTGFWRNYFDLDRDYAALRNQLDTGDYLKKAVEFGTGIRILRQDKWEALCSFVISQCNNIMRIKKIIEALAKSFGKPITFEGQTLYCFPEAEDIAVLTPADLDQIRCGYRAEYIIEAARAVSSGILDLDRLSKPGYKQALTELKSLKGVGEKVANCVILYGLHIHEAFPVDVWMKKALSAHFADDFRPESFGKAAGLAQQYIFYYTRSGYLKSIKPFIHEQPTG